MTPSQILAYVTIAIFFVSCSSTPTTDVDQKTYSSSTQKEFEAIEKNDTYSNPPNHTSVKPTNRPSPIIKEVPRAKNKENQPPTPTAEISETGQLNSKNQERLLEINQNLAFFCMKHRKSTLFQDEEHCLRFTKKILIFCEKKHKLINTVMVNCIKSRLKKIH